MCKAPKNNINDDHCPLATTTEVPGTRLSAACSARDSYQDTRNYPHLHVWRPSLREVKQAAQSYTAGKSRVGVPDWFCVAPELKAWYSAIHLSAGQHTDACYRQPCLLPGTQQVLTKSGVGDAQHRAHSILHPKRAPVGSQGHRGSPLPLTFILALD